ncbi:MAG: CHAT domain-containing protein, partial [Planctomycetota bacterium]
MPTIVIRQTPNTDPVAFSVSRIDAYQDDPEPRAVPRPNDIFVADKPDRPLRRELRWYLEHFLDYPYAPATDRADETLAALKAWGQQAFNALFGGGPARDMYRQAITGPDDFKNLSLKIVASDPLVLAWPWEALCDPQHGYLAHHCHIDRQIQVDDPPELHPDLPTDRVNILMVTARPYEADVQYRAIARPLIDLIRDEGLPAEVTLLRPPTLDQLQKELQAKPGYYHVVHFDGHGGYGISNNDANPADTLNHDITPHQLRSAKGCLVFEKEDGSAHAVPAETIGTLLREHKIPAAVLNACQSATIDEHAEDAFASVAASLVRAGVRSVVAMAYSLYVSGAQRFLPDFYRELFNHGTFAPPVRGGRRAMLAKTARVCARGTYPLQDWLVPVLYQQQQGVNLDFVRKPSPPDGSNPEASEQEQQASDIFTQANLPHAADGFVG